MTRRVLWSGVLAAAALMAGCASAPKDSGDGLTLSGRLLVKVAATAGHAAQSHSAGFELRGDDRGGQMRLVGPLGTQVALASWTPQGAQLQDAQGTREFPGLAELAAAALGEPLPLQALLYWLRAEPWPGAPHQPLVTGNGFHQLGWAIDLGQWKDAAVVDARRQDPPGVSVRAKMDRGS